MIAELKAYQKESLEYLKQYDLTIENMLEIDNTPDFEAGFYSGIQVALDILEDLELDDT